MMTCSWGSARWKPRAALSVGPNNKGYIADMLHMPRKPDINRKPKL